MSRITLLAASTWFAAATASMVVFAVKHDPFWVLIATAEYLISFLCFEIYAEEG